MPTRRKIPLNKIEGVSAGGRATIDLRTDVRYHSIFLEYDTDTAGGATEANMETEVTNIDINIDGVTQRKASSSQIFDINRTKNVAPVVGNGTAPGYIPILFSEPQRETQVEKEATAWGMGGVSDFQIEIDIANNDGQVPSLKGFAIVDDAQEPPLGIVKWKRNVIQVAGAGELVYSLNTERGESYQSLFMFEGQAGDIDDYLIEWDGVKIADLTEYQHAAYIASMFNGNIDAVSGLIHLPFDDNHPVNALKTVKTINGQQMKIQELLLTLNMAAARNVTVISELLGLPD